MSNAGLRILSAGPGITIQDGGRRGFLRFGVTESGPMDALAHNTANRAAGVLCGSAAIEVSLAGIEVAAEGVPLTLSIAGGSFHISLDGNSLPSASVVRLDLQQKLAVRAGTSGAWCYIAVAGRFDLRPTLGSLAMHTRSGIGGSGITAGTLIPVADSRPIEPLAAQIVAPWLDRPEKTIRVILGPQDDYFDREQIEAFLEGQWNLSNQADRMAYLLDGPELAPARGFNIVSDGTAKGSIQIAGDGKPIVLMADRPPTGGYPKIATVIGPDLGRLAQMRPGQQFRFAAVSIEAAVSARRAESESLRQTILLRPLVSSFPSEFLLGKNLVDGAMDSFQEPPPNSPPSPKRVRP